MIVGVVMTTASRFASAIIDFMSEYVAQAGVLAQDRQQVAGRVADARHLEVWMGVEHGQMGQTHLAEADDADSDHVSSVSCAVRGWLAVFGRPRRRCALARRDFSSVSSSNCSYWPATCSQVNSAACRARAADPSRSTSAGSGRQRGDAAHPRPRHWEVQRCVLGHPAVVLVVMRDHGIAGAHRLDQRGIGAADGVPVAVAEAVEAQRLHPVGLVDAAEKPHLIAGRRHHLGVIRIHVGLVVAEDHQVDRRAGASRSRGRSPAPSSPESAARSG